MSDEVNNLSGKVGLDTTDYKAGVTELNRQIRVIESGFRASAAAMGDWDKSSQGLEMRTKALTQQIELQKQKISALSTEYEKVAAEKGADSRAAEELQIRINKQTETLGKMQSELSQSQKSLADMGSESKSTSGKVQDLGEKEDETSKKTGNFKTAMEGISKALKTSAIAVAGVATAVAGVGAAVGKLVLDTAGVADGLQEMSDKTGLSVEKLQELNYVGKQVGTDTDTITGSMAKMIRNMASAKDQTADYAKKLQEAKKSGKGINDIQMGTAAQAFQNLGISVTDASGHLRSSQDVFSEAINKLGQIPNETERDAAAMAIFGKSAQELNPLIKAGSDEIAKLTEKAHEVGAVMSDETVQGMGDLNDSLDSLKDGFKGTLGTLATAFLPGIKGLTESAGGYLKDFAAIVKGSNGDLGKMASGVGQLLGQIVNDVASQGPKLLKGGLGILQGIINAIVTNLPTMLPAVIQMIQSLVQFIVQNLPILIQAAIQILMTLANGIIQMLPQLLVAAIQIIISLANGIAQALPQLIPAIVLVIPQIITILLQNLPLLIQAALNIIIALTQGLISALPVLIQQMPLIVYAICDAIVKSLPLIGQAAVQIINTLLYGILDNIPLLGTATGQMLVYLSQGITNIRNAFLDGGKNLILGLWEGIQSQKTWLSDRIYAFFSNMVDGAKKALGINSPSTVFASIGKNMALGLGVGFAEQIENVKRGIATSVSGMAFAFNGAGGGGLAQYSQQSNQTNYYAPVINQYGAGGTSQQQAKRW
jgi:hypothetical protein